jgi:hypothetical protein
LKKQRKKNIKKNGMHSLKNFMNISIRKIIVKVRMKYAELRGHKGKRWNYEPGNYYMGRKKRK